MNPVLEDFKQNKDTLNFTIKDVDVSLVNGLRRIILSDVTTIGFNIDDYENSDLKVIKNTSCLHNEFLLHRLGLIPIYSDNIDKYDPSLYKFILKVKNETDSIIDITTKDIVIMNMVTNKPENNDKFFKKNDFTGDHILITKLKPNPDGNGEELHIEGKSSKGVGSEHIRFSPVSKLCFVNKIDPTRMQSELETYLINNKGKDSDENLTKRFKIEESERCYYVNGNGDPNVFDFIIESKGVLKSYKILIEGIKALIFKLKTFNINLDAVLKRETSTIEINESIGLMKGFDLTIKNESHTLGFLIQSYINMMYYQDNIIVGYMNPHPLQKEIKFRIKSEQENITQVHKVFRETSDYLIKILTSIKNDLIKQFEGKFVFKPKKKK